MRAENKQGEMEVLARKSGTEANQAEELISKGVSLEESGGFTQFLLMDSAGDKQGES